MLYSDENLTNSDDSDRNSSDSDIGSPKPFRIVQHEVDNLFTLNGNDNQSNSSGSDLNDIPPPVRPLRDFSYFICDLMV